MDCSTPGLPVHHQLPEFTQTHVHRVGDAIQPSYPLSSPSPAFNLSQHSVFSNESVLCIRWPKYWSFSFNISPSDGHSGLISFRMDWLDLCRRSIQIFYKYIYKYFINILTDQLLFMFIWDNKHSKRALEIMKKKIRFFCQMLTNWKCLKPVESV